MDLSGLSEIWCGELDDGLSWKWLLSPCGLQTEAAVLVLLVGLIVLLLHIKPYRQKLAAISQLPAAGLKSGMTGVEAVFCFASFLISTLHVIVLIAAIILHPDLHAHMAFQVVAAGVWLAVAVFSWQASGIHMVPYLRPFLIVTDLVYLAFIYVYASLYFQQRVFSILHIKALMWASVIELTLSGALTLVDLKVPRQPRFQAGYEALPDVESGTAKKSRTYISLFVDACRWSWPDAWHLRMRVFVCVLLLLSMRLFNIAVPYIMRNLINRLADAHDGFPHSFISLAYPWVFAYLAVTFFQGGAGGGVVGFINNIRSFLWIPVSQDAYRRISLLVFRHVLDLDLSFHLKRNTGEVTKQVDRGTNALQSLLSTVVFSIGPQLVDVFISASYVALALNPAIALIMFVTIGSYVPLTILVTEWRGGMRREMNKTDNVMSGRLTDALLNWETVKNFCNEEYEHTKYAEAIGNYQRAEYKFLASLNILNIVQSSVMFVGMASGILVSVKGVADGQMTVGDVTMFLTLMQQLYAPLNFFGTYYRIIQQYMIDMENLFDLLDQNTSVPDAPHAPRLQLTAGEIDFCDVVFRYEENRDVLKQVSFHIDGGKTIAFVGATGSGKSTITRLLFRFYDTLSGDILVDGQRVKAMQQKSLRAVIGMVPQDCVLFNDTIRHNIRYGKITATDEEVEAAAAAACIHDTITQRFPLGYNTVVGERGLRLSGGEKQRVAFARALLKNPPILVLDEATSALDSITEKQIQGALRQSRSQRTTLIVAHRLSTIMDADAIAVMQDGRIAEFGTHQALLDQGGLYTELWSKQQSQQDQEGEGNGEGGTL